MICCEFTVLKRDDPEWAYAWDSAVPGPDKECLNNFEVWQYMGSWNIGKGWIHEFRHRCHPDTDERTMKRVKASQDFVNRIKNGEIIPQKWR